MVIVYDLDSRTCFLMLNLNITVIIIILNKMEFGAQ